jgi:hypothetical protein
LRRKRRAEQGLKDAQNNLKKETILKKEKAEFAPQQKVGSRLFVSPQINR